MSTGKNLSRRLGMLVLAQERQCLHAASLQRSRDHGADLLPLEKGVRRREAGSSHSRFPLPPAQQRHDLLRLYLFIGMSSFPLESFSLTPAGHIKPGHITHN
jgi:hypothetical protein